MKGAFLLVLFFTFATADHFCSEKESQFFVEELLGRDVSSVKHEEQWACSIKFADGRLEIMF
jgi:hypothetical protein